MNDKQRRFCQEYLIDLCASQAALRAGYSPKTARAIGAENLTKPDIQTEITRLQTERSQRLDITADDVLEDLAALGFTPITEVLEVLPGNQVVLKPSDEWSDDARKAVEGVRQSKDGFSVKMVNKLAALEKLGHHLGLFSDLTVAIATLGTYGTVTQTEEGYRVKLHP